ncbi:hypothetical protein HK100_004969 [Physocladia obscura]|uniref:Uncharacterized protein n=1 Tax=Physocladia obscura TaxID=109957 RepID=A0AAD5XCN2_9FUNG|nr:hypothetical protein HK100_004969 [Physocladia obscura]
MSFVKARLSYTQEQLVRAEEVNFVRENLKWCYRREGVNHLQNCRHLTQQYLELMRAAKVSFFVPFTLPKTNPVLDAEAAHHH